MTSKIKDVSAREILSAGAFPTIETKITLENGVSAKASVPYGTSAGSHEAFNMLDGDESRYNGKGVQTAVGSVNTVIADEIRGKDILDQNGIDNALNGLDPTEKKEKLGGNSVLSVSLAAIRTSAKFKDQPLYQRISDHYEFNEQITSLPKPMMVVIEGGEHADDSTDFQEYLVSITAQKIDTKDRVRAGIEIYRELEKILKQNGLNTNVGLEGAFAPNGITSNTKPLDYMIKAIGNAGYEAGEQALISLDVAASEFYIDGSYKLDQEGKILSAKELTDHYQDLIKRYPIYSIEDPFSEDDWENWTEFKVLVGDDIKVVGDDLTVTNKKRLQKAIEDDAINSIIIKPNQVGTLTETVETIKLAIQNGIELIVSHRGGGETTDTFIVDLAVAVGASFVKIGPSRGERVVKYNRLMEIAGNLGL